MVKQSQGFIDILEYSKDTDFTTHRYVQSPTEPIVNMKVVNPPKSLPTKPEVVAHLKLLKAFEVLKNNLVPGGNSDTEFDEYREKLWQCIVTIAVRRLIVFISALKLNGAANYPILPNERNTFKNANEKNTEFINLMDKIMPPLDVIMVWHAFLLNPKCFYDTCMRNNILHFANYPFPLQRVSQFIDNETFEFNVPEEKQQNYLDLIDIIEEKDNHPFNYQFSPQTHSVKLFCPICQTALTGSVSITNNKNQGFADPNFQSRNMNYSLYRSSNIQNAAPKSPCRCQGAQYLNHNEIRFLNLYHDVADNAILQGVYKHFSSVLCDPRYEGRRQDVIQEDIRNAVLNTMFTSDLTAFISSIKNRNFQEQRRRRMILREYLQHNYVSLTVQYGIQVGEDLVGCVLRQERFVQKINNLDWLHSPLIYDTLNESITRYHRFFTMLTEERNRRAMLVPCLDIDLIWHTHQLSMYGYFRDCKSSPCHSVIDHDDKIDESRLDEAFSHTSKIYKMRYKKNYSVCYCLYCTNDRAANKKQFMGGIFNTKRIIAKREMAMRRNPLFTPDKGLTHISTHNSIKLPTSEAKRKRKNSDIDWSYNYPTVNYAVAPYSPVLESLCGLYGNGTCTSARTNCASSNGLCSGFTSCSGGGGSTCVTSTSSAWGGSSSSSGGGCGSSSGGCGGGCGGS